MSTKFIISSVSFFVALVLLFYFMVKYRQAEFKDDGADIDLPEEKSSPSGEEPPAAPAEALRIFAKNSAGASAKEISDIKDKLKDLHYRFEEIKLLEEKRNAEAAKAIARVEQRISTFENEYVNKLQPALYSLISELENIQNKTKN